MLQNKQTNLLVAVAKAMKRAGVPDIHKRIIGVDIDQEMIGLARNMLTQIIGENANQIT